MPREQLERSQQRAYAGCKTTGTRLDDSARSGGEKGLRLYSEARSIPALTTLLPRPAARGVCARCDRVRLAALWGIRRRKSNGQFRR